MKAIALPYARPFKYPLSLMLRPRIKPDISINIIINIVYIILEISIPKRFIILNIKGRIKIEAKGNAHIFIYFFKKNHLIKSIR